MGLRQSAVAQALPRLVRPLPERVRYAAAWYADGIRVADIAAAAVMTHTQVTIAASAAGLDLRADRPPQPWTSLADILELAARASDQSLQMRFGLREPSLVGVRALLSDARPRVPRLVAVVAAALPKRCPSCLRVSVTDGAKSPCCGAAY